MLHLVWTRSLLESKQELSTSQVSEIDHIEEEPSEITARITPRRGRLFVVSGPSGVGKGTVIREAMTQSMGVTPLVKCVTATTRHPRPGEMDGVHYHFFNREEFERRIEQGYFLEYAAYNQNLYGTPTENVERERNHGKDVLLEIEVQGGLAVRHSVPDAILIFLAPPSWEVLADRLSSRNTETDEVVTRRLKIARDEIQTIDRYDYCVVNSELDQAVDAFRSIIIAERHRVVH